MKGPNVGYHFARWHGRLVRFFYSLFLPLIARQPIRPVEDIEIDVFAYSNEATLPEQVASIRSFLRHAGRPRRYVIVSDGSHSLRSIALLRQIDPSVAVESADAPSSQGSEKFQRYLREHPTGKQLALIMRLPQGLPALYVDSDVLFFPGAKQLRQLAQQNAAPAVYLADCQFAGDERLLRDEKERQAPANTGVLMLFRPLNWSSSIARFDQLTGDPIFFTNQTMTHLAMHENGAVALDPAKFVLQLDDQFIRQDRYAGPDLVLRHYVNPVRHKFWTSLT